MAIFCRSMIGADRAAGGGGIPFVGECGEVLEVYHAVVVEVAGLVIVRFVSLYQPVGSKGKEVHPIDVAVLVEVGNYKLAGIAYSIVVGIGLVRIVYARAFPLYVSLENCCTS